MRTDNNVGSSIHHRLMQESLSQAQAVLKLELNLHWKVRVWYPGPGRHQLCRRVAHAPGMPTMTVLLMQALRMTLRTNIIIRWRAYVQLTNHCLQRQASKRPLVHHIKCTPITCPITRLLLACNHCLQTAMLASTCRARYRCARRLHPVQKAS